MIVQRVKVDRTWLKSLPWRYPAVQFPGLPPTARHTGPPAPRHIAVLPGPPRSGQTMLARRLSTQDHAGNRRLPTILPHLTRDEELLTPGLIWPSRSCRRRSWRPGLSTGSRRLRTVDQPPAQDLADEPAEGLACHQRADPVQRLLAAAGVGGGGHRVAEGAGHVQCGNVGTPPRPILSPAGSPRRRGLSRPGDRSESRSLRHGGWPQSADPGPPVP